MQDNVTLPIFERDQHYSRRAAGERAATILDTVHLPLSVLAKYPYELSSGPVSYTHLTLPTSCSACRSRW